MPFNALGVLVLAVGDALCHSAGLEAYPKSQGELE